MKSRLTDSGEFWNYPGRWPRDAPDGKYIFLARAIDIVGPELFPGKWDAGDPVTVRFAKNDAEEKENRERLERFKGAQEFIGTAIARGHLSYALRSHAGGGIKPARPLNPAARFSADDWNVDSFFPFFSKCKMSDKAPAINLDEDDWIFVDKAQLEGLLAAWTRSGGEDKPLMAPAEALADVYLSPFLRFMVEFLALQGGTPEEQSLKVNSEKKAALEGLLVTEWAKRFPHLEPLGKTKSEYMATFLRELEGQSGRNRPK